MPVGARNTKFIRQHSRIWNPFILGSKFRWLVLIWSPRNMSHGSCSYHPFPCHPSVPCHPTLQLHSILHWMWEAKWRSKYTGQRKTKFTELMQLCWHSMQQKQVSDREVQKGLFTTYWTHEDNSLQRVRQNHSSTLNCHLGYYYP